MALVLGEDPKQEEKTVHRHVVREERTPAGFLRRERFYVKNVDEEVRHGVQELWYQDRAIQSIQQFVNGKQCGVELNWIVSEDTGDCGFLLSVTPYLSGRQHGDWIEFYNDGRKRREATYMNGKIVDSRLSYDYNRRGERRVVLEERFDKDGEKFYQLGWDDKGNKVHEGQFKGEEGWVAQAFANLERRLPPGPHGKWTYWVGKDRKQEVHGEFRNGKPWEGICHDPDTRYKVLPGLGSLNRYSDGKLVEANVRFQ